jgi:hypothetical protein
MKEMCWGGGVCVGKERKSENHADEAIAANCVSQAAEGQKDPLHFHPATLCARGNQPDYFLLPLW